MKLDIVTQQYWNDRHSDLHRIPFINILNCHFVHRYNRNKNKDWTINLMLFMFKYFLLMNGVKENKRHYVDHSNTYLLRIFRKIFQPTFLLPYNQIIENTFFLWRHEAIGQEGFIQTMAWRKSFSYMKNVLRLLFSWQCSAVYDDWQGCLCSLLVLTVSDCPS